MGAPAPSLQLISGLWVGGSERLLVDFAKSASLRPDFPQVVVVMNDLLNDDLLRELRATSFPVYCLRRRPGDRSPRYLWQLMQIIRRHGVRLVHAHNWGSKWWAVLCKLADPRLRIVYTVHETGFITSYGAVSRRLFRRLVDRTIAVSEPAAADCRSIGLMLVTTINNGVPLSRFRPVEAGRPLPDRPRIMHVGRLSHTVKGQDVLLRALRICGDRGFDLRCDLVGSPLPDDPASFHHLQALAASLGLTSKVRFLVDRTDIPELLLQADIFVLPSRREGFGLSALEAMAAGLPVIVSSVGGVHEYVRDGENALVFRDGDERDLADKITLLLSRSQVREAVAAGGRSTAMQFDISVMRDRYFDLYRQVLGD